MEEVTILYIYQEKTNTRRSVVYFFAMYIFQAQTFVKFLRENKAK